MSLTPRISQTLPSTANTADPITPVYVPELSADKISSGTISAATVIVGDDGIIKVGTGSTTVELVADGLYGYVDNTQVFRLANGELFVKGTVQADRGYFAGDLVGNTLTGGVINGSTITGGTITIGSGNAVFQATGLGISVGSGVFASAPFRVSADGTLTASNATITGTITGSTITGSAITGSTIDASGSFRTGPTNAAHLTIRQQPPSGTSIYDVGMGIIEFFSGIQDDVGAGSRSYLQATRVPGAGSRPAFSMVSDAGSVVIDTRDTALGYVPTVTLSASRIVHDSPYHRGRAVVYRNTAVAKDYSPVAAYNGSTFAQVVYWMTAENTVRFGGLMSAVTALSVGTVLFTLDQEFWPSQIQILNVTFGTSLYRCDVTPNGNVTVQAATIPASAYVNFNGAEFYL